MRYATAKAVLPIGQTGARMMHLRKLLTMAAILVSGAVLAGKLPADKWAIRSSDGAALPRLADGKLETAHTLKFDELEGTLSVTIDLRAPHLVHRVYWCGNQDFRGQGELRKRARGAAGTILVFVGDGAQGGRQVAELPLPVETTAPAPGSVDAAPTALNIFNGEGDARFPLTAGRYVRLEARGVAADFVWILGEVEVYGFAGPATKGDAVVLAKNAPVPLAFAAQELSYYVSELTGRPHPIVAPEDAKDYPGTHYRVEDLKPFAPSYEEMVKNQAAGKFPATPVNVERDGDDVVFRAWPYANVLASVWEFLERQGVRWVCPDPQGEFVPRGKGVSLAMLPLRYTSPADLRYANFEITGFLLSLGG